MVNYQEVNTAMWTRGKGCWFPPPFFFIFLPLYKQLYQTLRTKACPDHRWSSRSLTPHAGSSVASTGAPRGESGAEYKAELCSTETSAAVRTEDFAAMEDSIPKAGRNQRILAHSGGIYVPGAFSVRGFTTRNSNFEFAGGKKKQSLEKGLV